MDGQMNDSPRRLMEDPASEVHWPLNIWVSYRRNILVKPQVTRTLNYTPSCFLLTHCGVYTRMYWYDYINVNIYLVNNLRSLSKFKAIFIKQVFMLWEVLGKCESVSGLILKYRVSFFLTRSQCVFIIELLKN